MNIARVFLSIAFAILFISSLPGKTLNVKEYSALGDGETDDTESIKMAINALKAGDTLYFPENGQYMITSALLFYKSNVVVEFGPNTWIIADSLRNKADYTHAKHNCLFYSVNQKDIEFLNLRIDGKNIPAKGVYMWACSNIKFINSRFKNLSGTDKLWSVGLDLRRCHHVLIDTCEFTEITNTNKSATGVLLDSNPKAINTKDICTNIYIKNSLFKNIRSADDADGIKFVGRLIKKDLYSSSIVEKCTFINCYKRAVKIQTNGIKVLNNVIENTRTTKEIGWHLIDIQGVDSVEISGNHITFNERNLAAIGFILPNKNITLKNNEIIFDGDTLKNVRRNYGIYTMCWTAPKGDSTPPFWGENVNIENISIYTINGGELDYGIYLFTTTGGGRNWKIDSVSAENSPFGITEGFENIIIRNSSFSKIIDMTRRWDFDENTGDKAYTQFYNLNRDEIDLKIYSGYTGILNNMIWTEGKNNSGLRSNGTDGYLDFHSGNLWLMENKTLMVWMKVDEDIEPGSETHRFYPGIFSHLPNGANKNFVSFDRDPVLGTYHLIYSDESENMRRSESFEYSSGNWIHLAIVMSRDSIPSFYINGEYKGSDKKSMRTKLNYLGKGFRQATNDRAFPGIFDDMRILNKVIDADSIKNYYYKF